MVFRGVFKGRSIVLLQRGWCCTKLSSFTFLEVTLSLRDAGATFQFHCFYEIVIHLLKSDLSSDYSHPVQLLLPIHNLRDSNPHLRNTSLSEDIFLSFVSKQV